MRDLIKKKLVTARILCILIIVLLVTAIVPFFSFSDSGDPSTAATLTIFFSGSALIILCLFFFPPHFSFMLNIRRLKKADLLGIGDDIDLSKEPTFPDSKIYCGQKAFFCKKSLIFLPYDKVAWVYVLEDRTNYLFIHMVTQSICIHTTDGKGYVSKATLHEVATFVERYLAPNAPGVMVGHTDKKAAEYKKFKKSLPKSHLGKKIGGISLMLSGLIFLLALILNFETANIPAAIILIAVTFGSGLLLYMKSKK